MKRLATLALSFVLSCAGLTLAGDAGAPATETDLTTIARSRVILVVEAHDRDPKAFSGMAGSTFWFRVREVLRFEREEGMTDAGWRLSYETLVAHGRDLDALRLLEWSWLYPEDDRDAAVADAALAARLTPGKTFVLATPTTAWFSATGVMREAKWGLLMHHGDPTLVEVDAVTLERLRGRLDDPRRLPSPGLFAPAPPTPSPGPR